MFLLSSHIASSARWIMSSACSPLATAWSPPSRSVGYRYMIHVRLVPPEAEYISNIYIYVWVNKYIYIYIYRIYVHQYTYIIIHHSSYTQLYTHSNLYKYINYVYIYIYTQPGHCKLENFPSPRWTCCHEASSAAMPQDSWSGTQPLGGPRKNVGVKHQK